MQLVLEAKRNLFKQIVKLSPIIASKLLYLKTFNQRLNLQQPETFNEKLMWLKLFEDIDFKSKFTDKVEVRKYLKTVGLEHLLVPLIDVFESEEDIIFEQLPKRFIVRCSHGSHLTIICNDKRELDYHKTRQQLAKWMATDYSLKYAEPHYSSIKPRILIEHFIEQTDNKMPTNYKIHCFHSEPKIIELTLNRYTPEEQSIMLTPNWRNTNYIEKRFSYNEKKLKPNQLDELLAIAKKLSKPFTYVRVDLNIINEKIYFKELQFTPGACLNDAIHEEANIELGQWLQLKIPKYKQPVSIARQ